MIPFLTLTLFLRHTKGNPFILPVVRSAEEKMLAELGGDAKLSSAKCLGLDVEHSCLACRLCSTLKVGILALASQVFTGPANCASSARQISALFGDIKKRDDLAVYA